jgi:hypothetical protein
MKRILFALFFLIASFSVCAQTSPGLYNGQVPTATQWNGYFSGKMDYQSCPVTGGVFTWGGSSWTCILSTTGTVTSVSLALPSIFSVSGSPISTSGTLTGSLNTQSANTILAGPSSGSANAPTFRALVGADLPNPSSTTLGGVESYAAISHQFINAISTSGAPGSAQPAFGDLSGSVACAQLPALTGDATTSSGACAVAVGKINGTSLAGLATGLLKNTTGTGVPSIAASGTDYPAVGVISATGPIGSATAAPVVTVNANGQTTALTSVTITPAVGSVTGLGIGVATALGNNLNASGGVLGATTPPLAAETFSTSPTVTAGTNAQGQGALTSDYNVVTTASSNPSGATLPTATVGRKVIVINKGANPINVYPATSGAIDALSTNTSVSLLVGAGIEFNADTTTHWNSTLNYAGAAPTSLPLSNLASQSANTVVGALTATTPSALAVPSCSTSGSALLWTSGGGFSCNTTILAATAPISGLTGAGTGVLTALGVNVGSAGAPVLYNGAGGTPSSMTGTNITGTASGFTVGTANAVPLPGIIGLGTGVATVLGNAVTGSGAPVAATSPTVTTQTIDGYTESSCAPTITAGAITITVTSIPTGCSAISTLQKLSLVANTTVTLPTPAAGISYSLLVCASGAYSPTWAIASGTLSWPAGSIPAATATSGKCDLYSFVALGSSYLFGSAVLNFTGS